jgi:hypothetical protein
LRQWLWEAFGDPENPLGESIASRCARECAAYIAHVERERDGAESLADKYNRTVSLMGNGKNYVADSSDLARQFAEARRLSAPSVGERLNAAESRVAALEHENKDLALRLAAAQHVIDSWMDVANG